MSEEKESKKPAADGEKGEAKKKGGGLPLMPIMLAVIVIANAVTAFVQIQMTKPKPVLSAKIDGSHGKGTDSTATDSASAVAKDSAKSSEDAMTDISDPIDVMVNVSGTDAERFMKIAVALEFSLDPKAEKAGGEGKAKSPQKDALKKIAPRLKNTLMEIVAPMTLEQLQAPDAKGEIRKAYLKEINKYVPAEVGKIRDVFITDFIIQ